MSVCVCVSMRVYVYSMMASSLLRSTSDFLAKGIDECLNQLYDCAEMQSPDSSGCSSASDTSLLTYNTQASFNRRFLTSLQVVK